MGYSKPTVKWSCTPERMIQLENKKDDGSITYVCKHPETGERLHWMYYDEYLKLEEKDDNENGKH